MDIIFSGEEAVHNIHFTLKSIRIDAILYCPTLNQYMSAYAETTRIRGTSCYQFETH